MTNISADISMQNVRAVKARQLHTPGQPVRLTLESHTGLPSYINLFVGDACFASRLVDAINGAATPPAEDHDEEFQAAVLASIAYFNRYAGDRS